MKDNHAIPEASAAIEKVDASSKLEIPELPQIRAENFSCPTFVFKPKISLEKAKILFTEKYVASEKRLPDGVSIQSVANTARFVYVPSWLIAGSAFGEWRATGRNVDTHLVNCERCGGKGTIGDDENTQKCPVCQGTGKIDQHKNRDSTERGTAKASVEEHVRSTFGGIEFNPDFSTAAKPAQASPGMIDGLYCLQPEHDHKKAKEILTERLALALKNKAVSDLAHYDLIEDLHFGSTEVYLFNKVELWLHPFYICWYEKGGKKQFAICDGISGNVELPKQKSNWSLLKNPIVLLILGLMIYFATSMLLGHNAVKTTAAPEIPVEPVKPNAWPFGANAFKPLPPLDDPVYEQDKPSVIKPVKKPVHVSNSPISNSSALNAPVAGAFVAGTLVADNKNPQNLSGKSAKKLKLPDMQYPSFDCNAATIRAERLICSSKELADDDRKLAEAFGRKKKATFFELFKRQMEYEQADWIENVRNVCTDEVCLSIAYRKRLGALSPSIQPKTAEPCPIPGHCQTKDDSD
jgi:hypothetical protein